MTQTFRDIPDTLDLTSSRPRIVERDEALRSSFAGPVFPQASPVDGQPAPVDGQVAYRDDLARYFGRVAGAWQQLGLLADTFVVRATQTSLAALDPVGLNYATDQRAATLGRETAGDGGGGIWRWAPAATDAAGPGVVRPSVGAASQGSNPGRWLLVAATPRVVLAASATPSVAGIAFAVTSGATAITDFTGAAEGQRFVVERGDQDVTIVHDPVKIDCAGLDVRLTAARPRVEFVHVDGVFRLLTTTGASPAVSVALAAATTDGAVARLGAVVTVASVEALRAKTWSGADRPTAALLQGEIGGVWLWDGTSTAADDGALVVKEAATDSGRWRRQMNIVADARWWGVRADGVTDDTAALNAALANPSVSELRLPPGDIRVSALTINRDNLIVRGVGRATRIICTSTTAHVFTIGDGLSERSAICLLDFLVWASVAKSAGWVVWARMVTDSVFDFDAGSADLHTANGHRLWDGLFFDRVSEVTFDGSVCVANQPIDARGNSDQSYGAELAIGSRRQSRILKAARPAVVCSGGVGGLYLMRVDISECGGGVVFDKSRTAANNREAFIGELCTIDNCTGWGVNVENDGIETLDLNCWISGCGDNAAGVGGVRVAPTTGVAVAIKAIGLRVQSCKYDGVQISAGKMMWIGGFCRSNGVGANGGHGVLLGDTGATRVVLQGVAIHNNGNGTRGWGVTLGATQNNFSIANCDLFSNGQGAINNPAGYGPARVVRDNRGFVTENGGQAVILNGSSTVVVSHGLDAVPNWPVLTNVNHGTACHATGLTATQFTITTSNGAPVGADTTLQWSIDAQ